jgi:hypothetical protein
MFLFQLFVPVTLPGQNIPGNTEAGLGEDKALKEANRGLLGANTTLVNKQLLLVEPQIELAKAQADLAKSDAAIRREEVWGAKAAGMVNKFIYEGMERGASRFEPLLAVKRAELQARDIRAGLIPGTEERAQQLEYAAAQQQANIDRLLEDDSLRVTVGVEIMQKTLAPAFNGLLNTTTTGPMTTIPNTRLRELKEEKK